ncbi:MAG: hypothetical protein ABR987_25020, partial [Terracidiphilus sp.]
NLVYDKIVVNGKSYDVQCLSDGTSCKGSGSYGTAAGLLYFLASDANLIFPFLQVNTAAANTPVVYSPPKSTDSGAAQPGPGGKVAPVPGPGGTVPPKPNPGGLPGKAPDKLQLFTAQPFIPNLNGVVANLAPSVAAQQ